MASPTDLARTSVFNKRDGQDSVSPTTASLLSVSSLAEGDHSGEAMNGIVILPWVVVLQMLMRCIGLALNLKKPGQGGLYVVSPNGLGTPTNIPVSRR
jgi:hypothetical protein